MLVISCGRQGWLGGHPGSEKREENFSRDMDQQVGMRWMPSRTWDPCEPWTAVCPRVIPVCPGASTEMVPLACWVCREERLSLSHKPGAFPQEPEGLGHTWTWLRNRASTLNVCQRAGGNEAVWGGSVCLSAQGRNTVTSVWRQMVAAFTLLPSEVTVYDFSPESVWACDPIH